MAKPKISYKIVSYGIYEGWDKNSKDLPKIKKFCETLPAKIGIEFGYVLNIKKAKGKKIYYRIEHPPFPDDNGNEAPPFTGELYVRTNDWFFFLGDTIWEPVENKIGVWRLITSLENENIADKSFSLVDETEIDLKQEDIR